MATTATLEQVKSVVDLGGGNQIFRLVVTVTAVTGPDPVIVGYDFDEPELIVFRKGPDLAPEEDVYQNIARLDQRNPLVPPSGIGVPIGRGAVSEGELYRIDTGTIDTNSALELAEMCAQQLVDIQQLVVDWQAYAEAAWNSVVTTPVTNT
jgi:hypothetical protein